jgi:NAD(P) transhydrogenase subunit alpha
MKIGIPKEVQVGEARVATTPEAADKLIKLGFSVAVETGAGDAASISDDAYRQAGAEIIDSTEALWNQSDN